ncbi:MAG: recombinase family protein [Rubrobacter sp.]|nr:recombinase family protein [Rubrobacter sp.]
MPPGSNQAVDQDLQRSDLSAAGCERIFEEQVGFLKEDRTQLRATFNPFRKGDELVVWKLDRLGCSLREITGLVNGLRGRGVEFVSLRESIDTTMPAANWCSTSSRRWRSSRGP